MFALFFTFFNYLLSNLKKRFFLNQNQEQNSVEQPNISTLVAKPEPTDPVRMETTFDLERFSLDSRTIQDVSDRSLSLRPDISNKSKMLFFCLNFFVILFFSDQESARSHIEKLFY